jgi:conjugative transposon TraN protein
MKQSILLFVCIFFSLAICAQNQIEVCQSKATHIISKEKISYLQVGDPNKIVAEIVAEHSNMVRIKAVDTFGVETSLTLVSANKAYSIFVSYANTNKISYKLDDFHGMMIGAEGTEKLPEYVLKELSNQILNLRMQKSVKSKTKKDGLIFRIRNIYLKHDVLFFELELTNTTNIGYEIQDFYWWIDGKKEVKATNVQEYQVETVYQHYKLLSIPAKTTLREVFVLPKLTIPDKRILRIEVLEKALGNTGRKLSLDVKNKQILKAKSF